MNMGERAVCSLLSYFTLRNDATCVAPIWRENRIVDPRVYALPAVCPDNEINAYVRILYLKPLFHVKIIF